jgi:hypothetical protein
MKRRFTIPALMVASVSIWATMVSSASAYPSLVGCVTCHGSTTALVVKATQLSNNGITASYRVDLSGAPAGPRGFAVANPAGTHVFSVSASTGTFSVPAGKTYTIWAVDNNMGARSLAITPKATPALSTTGAGTIAYGAKRSIIGTLSAGIGKPIAGRTVVLKSASSATATSWASAATTTTVASGRYKFVVAPTTTKYYRVSFAGDATYNPRTSGTMAVAVQVFLSAPVAPSVVTSNVAFATYGYLKPRHVAGAKSILIQCQRLESGIWVLKQTVSATNSDYLTYTKYTASLKLASSGSWRLRAYHPADTTNAATYSGWTSRTVK